MILKQVRRLSYGYLTVNGSQKIQAGWLNRDLMTRYVMYATDLVALDY
jgi:hypothetical protein